MGFQFRALGPPEGVRGHQSMIQSLILFIQYIRFIHLTLIRFIHLTFVSRKRDTLSK